MDDKWVQVIVGVLQADLYVGEKCFPDKNFSATTPGPCARVSGFTL